MILTLFVGLGHGKKIKNIKDYALGGRTFSTGALVATITSTWVSGSGFFIVLSKTYTDGLYYLIASLCMAFQLVFVAFAFVPRMKEFLGNISIAESMGNIYGKRIRFITALTGTLGSIGTIAIQFKAFGTVLSYFSSYSPSIAVLIAGLIVTAYSASGGIKAVTTTDILQFAAFGFAIPFVGMMIWNQLFYQDFSVLSALNDENFNYKIVLNTDNAKFWTIIPLALYFIVPGMEPTFCQRIIIGRDIKQVKKALIISAIGLIFIKFAVAWISFLLFAANPNIASSDLLGYIIDNYTITGMKGLVIVGIIAMAMSTADSFINSSSVLFAHDICNPLKLGEKNSLLLSRAFSVVLGLCSIKLALSSQDLLSMNLIASSLYMPIITAPLILTILGFRSTEKSVLIGMFAGGFTVIFWDSLNIGADSIIMSVLVNTVFLLASHYLLKQKGGWVIKNKKTNISIKSRLNKIFRSIPNIKLKNSLNKLAPQKEVNYVSLGVYFLIYTLTTIYSTQVALLETEGGIVLIMYQIMLITGTLMTTFPIWPLTISDTIRQKVVKIFWFVSIIYMLVFFNSFFVITSGFSKLQFSIFSINLIVTALLIGWKLSVIIIPLGFYLSTQFFYSFFGEYSINSELISPDFISIYAAMLTCFVLIIFLKPKQDYLENTEQRADALETKVMHLGHNLTDMTGRVSKLNKTVSHYSERVLDQEKEIERLGAAAQKILNNVNHEMRIPIGSVMNFSDMLHESLMNTEHKHLLKLSDEVVTNSTRLSSMILNMLDLAMLDVKKIELEKSTINFSELVKDRVKGCRDVYLQDKPIDFKLTIDPEILILIDQNYIRQVVDNIMINAISFSDSGLIEVTVKKKQHMVELTITDQGKGIPIKELADIFDPFKMGSNTESKAEGRGVGLALCKSAVEAHGGVITAESKGKGATFKVILPLR